MKKLFISQPMRGKTDEEILREREEAIAKVKDLLREDVEVIDSYFKDYNPNEGCIPLKYLAKSLELLADADVVYFAKGWIEARGCVAEHHCVLVYEIPYIYGN